MDNKTLYQILLIYMFVVYGLQFEIKEQRMLIYRAYNFGNQIKLFVTEFTPIDYKYIFVYDVII